VRPERGGALRSGVAPDTFAAPRETDVAKRTPLYDAHLAASARMIEFAGFDMPVQYQGLVEEHFGVRERAGIFDVSHMGEIVLEGQRALEAAQRLVTNDLSACKDGQAQYAALCNERGGVIDDVIVYRFSERRLFVCVNATGREKDYEWMRDHAGPGVKVEQQSDDWGQVAVQGPQAAKLVDALCKPSVIDVPYYHFREATVAGVRGCIVSRTGYTGEDGFEVFCPSAGTRRIWDAVLEVGAVPCGLGARDTLRLEAAYRLYGNDMDEQHTPLEAGLGWIVKLDKSGGFIGAEALREQKAQGLKRKLVGFKVTAKRNIARHGYPVRPAGVEKHVGEVTSGTMSPTLKEPIGLAYVPTEMSPIGTCFEVEIREHAFPAEVVKTPFVSKKAAAGERKQS
jgi:aminomethyltransferase